MHPKYVIVHLWSWFERVLLRGLKLLIPRMIVLFFKVQLLFLVIYLQKLSLFIRFVLLLLSHWQLIFLWPIIDFGYSEPECVSLIQNRVVWGLGWAQRLYSKRWQVFIGGTLVLKGLHLGIVERRGGVWGLGLLALCIICWFLLLQWYLFTLSAIKALNILTFARSPTINFLNEANHSLIAFWIKFRNSMCAIK